jgi:multisubunit Na+/H+ antiporter MnhG subunit
MSTMEDRDTAMTRDPAHGPLPNRGYAQQYGYGRPPMYNRTLWAETRPSFLTSEFMFTILGVIGIAITAATAADIDSRLATTLITGLLAAYVISRGIAKAASRSNANDPRDDLHLGDHR